MSLGDDLRREAGESTVSKIAQLLKRSGIEVEDIASVQRVNVWQGFMRGEDGDPQIVDLAGVSLVPCWAEGPKWPVVQPGPAVRLPSVGKSHKTADHWKTCVVLPDMQIGYYRDAAGNLQPTHDEDAISVALSITKAAKPDLVVMVGDNLDLPEMGKYRLSPAFVQTTQATVDRSTLLCAEVRRAAPDAEIVWLAGNHEERLPRYVMDNAVAAFGLRRGMEPPQSWPVMSVPFLCKMDEFGVEYRPGYPASTVWINERLRVIHGDRVKSRGSTAHAYLEIEKTSVIYGHVHRREWAERTREDYDGPKTVLAASPGCLARIDGVVPSTHQGLDLDGRPLTRHENWQQGLAVVSYEEGDGRFVYEQIPIRDGWAMWRGREYAK